MIRLPVYLRLLCALPVFGLSMAALPAAAGQPSTEQGATQAQDAETPPPAFMHSMQKMRGEIARLHDTKDPKLRAKLLDEHMRTMQSTLQMMMSNGGMSGGPMHGKGKGMMVGSTTGQNAMMSAGMSKGGMMAAGKTGQGGANTSSMERGRMMQMMMSQMMQHQNAMKAMHCQ